MCAAGATSRRRYRQHAARSSEPWLLCTRVLTRADGSVCVKTYSTDERQHVVQRWVSVQLVRQQRPARLRLRELSTSAAGLVACHVRSGEAHILSMKPRTCNVRNYRKRQRQTEQETHHPSRRRPGNGTCLLQMLCFQKLLWHSGNHGINATPEKTRMCRKAAILQ